jgi:hypothetical protein
MTNWTLGQLGKTNPIQTQYKPNSKPIKAKTNPIQTQTNPTCRGVASGEAGSKPIKC